MLIAGNEKLSDFGSGTAQRSFLRLAVVAERVHLRIPSRVDWIELAVMYLAGKAESIGACSQDRHSKLVTALTEAVTNAIVHGNLEIPSSLKEDPNGAFARTLAERSSDPAYADRLVDIVMDYDGVRCAWTITDQGPGFDVEQVLARLDSDDPAVILASGRGIMLMKAFVDEVTWSQGGRCCRMALERQDCEEKRVERRVRSRQPVRAVPLADDGQIDWDAAFDAVATDLSRGGIGLLKNGLDSAQRLMIELRVGDQPVYVPAQVCRLQQMGDGMVQIGCRFTDEPPPADPDTASAAEAVEALIGRLSQPGDAGDERRQQPRITFTRPVRIATPEGEEFAAVSRDLSKTGMSFVTEMPIEKGRILDLHIDPGGEAPLRMRAQVTRCHRMAAHFHDIGVRFME